MGVIITTMGARLEYEIAQKALAAEGVIVQPGQLSQSFLRTECILSSSKSSFSFPIQVNQLNAGTTPSATAQLLKQQDAFYMTHMAFWVEAYTIAGDIPELYRYMPFTYPSEVLNEAGLVLSRLGYKLWSGVLELTVNGQVILPAWDLKRHLFVPQTQREQVSGAWPVSSFFNGHDEFDGAASSFYPVEPNIVFIGNKSSVITVDYPEDLANAVGAAPLELRGVLTMRGMLAQNASKTA